MINERDQFNFDNTYARELEGFYVSQQGDNAPKPQVIKTNAPLAKELGVSVNLLKGPDAAAIFSGSKTPEGANPLAQAYAGHQFGGFSPQLGDGRALLLGEVIDTRGNRRDIQLKGSGRTPFSRGGDGKAALGPVLREYIVSEAMHRLNIPTTRSLAAVTTGENVVRETNLPGAVLTRVAASHLRVGTFQFFAARDDAKAIRKLADYAIARHYPHLEGQDNRYLSFLEAVADAQGALIAKWMLVGFVHGVMNTDNMTISGETIDYGPCAFIDAYEADALFSSIDAQGRYSYKNQPAIGQWNIARLAETLLSLIDEDTEAAIKKATSVVEKFSAGFQNHWLEGMRLKLGLATSQPEDGELAGGLMALIDGKGVDFTLLFRGLAQAAQGKDEALLSLFENSMLIEAWLEKWRERLEKESASTAQIASAMNQVNPLYIARNHKVEEALSAAVEDGDYSKFEKLVEVLDQPYEERAGLEEYAIGAPENFGPYKTFCGT